MQFELFENQQWISDIEIDGLTFVLKKRPFFTKLGQVLSQKVGFFLLFEPISRELFRQNVGRFK